MLSGRLAASGDHRTLRRMMTDRPHTVRIRSTNDRALASALLSSPTVMGVDIDADALMVRTADYTGFAHHVGVVAQRASITLLEVQPTDESLEHVFAYLVAR